MKNLYLLFLLAFATVQSAWAQTTPTLATGYYFKQQAGVSLEDMTGATELVGATRDDGQVSAETPITFPFEFVGKTFDAFQAFSTGAFILTQQGVEPMDGYQLLLPWADAIGTGDNGHISYKVVGTTNRKLVVEFYMSDYIPSTAFAAIADKKFQVWLFENTNQIQFVYGDGAVDAAQALVGIAGTDTGGDLLQIDTENHEVNTDPYYISTTWPGNGQSYIFSPIEFTTIQPRASVSTNNITTVCQGGSVLLQAALADANAQSFQWLKNGLPIADANSQTLEAVETGSYTVQVNYEGGTVISDIINVFVTNLSATLSSTNISCNSANNGVVTISDAAGGNDLYEYSINNGAWKTSPVFSNLMAGTYAVQMRSGDCVKQLGSVKIKDESVPPAVSIVSEKADACNNVVLKAYPENAASYTWSNGATGQVITLGNNDADGSYTVTASNGNGCAGSATYKYSKENQLNSYTIVATLGVSLGQNNTVNGSVGNKGLLPVYIDRNTQVNGSVRSLFVSLGRGADVTGSTTHNFATVKTPTVYANTAVTTKLPNQVVNDNATTTLAGNFNNLTIGKKARVTLSGNVFGKIAVKEGATVTFTHKDVSIDDLVTDDGSKNLNTGRYTSVSFASGSKIRIKNVLDFGKRNNINAEGSTFYLDDTRNDAEKLKIDGGNTTFSGNVIISRGILSVRGSSATEPCVMNGVFICEILVSDDYVTWNRPVCNTFAPRAAAAAAPATVLNNLKAGIYPNPASGNFNVVLKSALKGSARVQVTNENGAVVFAQTYTNVQLGSQLPVNISNQSAGIYLVKVSTEAGTQTYKMVIKK